MPFFVAEISLSNWRAVKIEHLRPGGILSLGELLVDMVSSTTDAAIGEAREWIKAPGGAPANVAVGAAKLGVSAKFVGCVGDDPFGLWLRELVREQGVDVRDVQLSDHARTTIAFVATRADGKKDICFYRNPGADALLDAQKFSPALFDGVRILHCGSVSLSLEPCRGAQFEAVQKARESGVLVSFDPNWRPSLWDDFALAHELIWRSIPQSDLVKIADEEWKFVTGHADFESGAAKILESGPQLVVMTSGGEDVRLATREFSLAFPAFRVSPLDTLGAGDAFVAAFLSFICRHNPENFAAFLTPENLREAARYANAAGAIATQKFGAIPALPTHDEVLQWLARES